LSEIINLIKNKIKILNAKNGKMLLCSLSTVVKALRWAKNEIIPITYIILKVIDSRFKKIFLGILFI